MNASHLFLCLCLLQLEYASTANAQWVQTSGPGGGKVGCLAISHTNLFAGTDSGGVFLSTDNGASWNRVNNGLTNTFVRALAVNDTSLFAGTGGGGIFLSTNYGASWETMNTGLTNHNVLSFAISPDSSGILFAGTYGGGVFLSTNNGGSWTPVDSGLTDHYVYALAASGTNLFAGTYGRVFLSTNNGTSWAVADSGLPGSGLVVKAFAVSGSNLFAAVFNAGVYLSTNNGANWTAVNTGLLWPYYPVSFSLIGTNLFVGSYTRGVYLSTNNGANWTTVNTGLTFPDVSALAASPDSLGTLFAGTNAGVWRRPLSEMLTSVETSKSNLPSLFNLEQNYPNPFNLSTTIWFSLPHSGFVTLKIFNLLGEEIETLLLEILSSGTRQVDWHAGGVPSGVYFYRLQAGSFIETKKLILLR